MIAQITIQKFLPLFSRMGLFSAIQEKEAATETIKPRTFELWPSFINMLIVLAVVVGIILLISWIARKITGKQFSIGRTGFMDLVSTLPIGDKKFVSILRVGQKYYLLGISTSQITNLGEIDSDEVEKGMHKSDESGEGSFAKILKRFKGDTGEAKH